MLNLFGKKISALILLLYLFALFISRSSCKSIQPYFPASSASLEVLEARTGTSSKSHDEIEIPITVLSLWRNAAKKVPVNNNFVETTLDPTKNTVITTAACYGCTAVALCSGTTCVMAHFREKNGAICPWVTGAAADESFEANVEGPIEDVMSMYKTKLGLNPFAIIFTPSGPGRIFKYKTRIQGKGSIQDTIIKEFPQASVLNIGYNYARAMVDLGDDEVWGKIVLEWKGGKAACAEMAGVSVLNVFAEESWHRSFHFDNTGASVTATNSRCTIPNPRIQIMKSTTPRKRTLDAYILQKV